MVDVFVASVPMDVFLFITFGGVFVYLMRIYRMWREPSIGFWGFGSLLVSISVVLHYFSLQFMENKADSIVIIYYKATLIISFLSFWAFGVSHMIARRSMFDVLGITLLSVSFGALVNSISNRKFDIDHSAKTFIDNTNSNEYSFFLFLFLIILYFILARDSYIIYKASITSSQKSYRRSIAITHLIAWQFWGVSTIISRLLSSSYPFLSFTLPFVFLLVPIITLGSRPFDWAREGYEPLILLLVDEFGIPAFSWSQGSSSPLLMEGSSIATIRSMLGNITKDDVRNMNVNYDNTSLFLQSSNGYLSILITTGYHKSYLNLLAKIHLILVTSIVKPNEFGIPGYEVPNELEWLLNQLLPDKQYSYANKTNSWSDFFKSEELNDIKGK
ncbi:MAG: hypothetical protein ACXAD7_05915 [Candidatus Kariarchaeaceae archaeon]|jgi:hypothetical protein